MTLMFPDNPAPQIAAVGDIIRLAVAPVFLLSGVGAMLGVLTSRLARAVDRARQLERSEATTAESELGDLTLQLAVLARRARLLNAAITLCTICSLLVSLVIITLFLSASFEFNFSSIISLLFIVAMMSFAGSLLCFLREVFIATSTLRIGLARLKTTK